MIKLESFVARCKRNIESKSWPHLGVSARKSFALQQRLKRASFRRGKILVRRRRRQRRQRQPGFAKFSSRMEFSSTRNRTDLHNGERATHNSGIKAEFMRPSIVRGRRIVWHCVGRVGLRDSKIPHSQPHESFHRVIIKPS